MTRVVKKQMYCSKCNEFFEVPVVLSTNSYMLEMDKNLREKYNNGTLFKNACPKCGEQLKETDKK